MQEYRCSRARRLPVQVSLEYYTFAISIHIKLSRGEPLPGGRSCREETEGDNFVAAVQRVGTYAGRSVKGSAQRSTDVGVVT